jgi:hypothetical protein
MSTENSYKKHEDKALSQVAVMPCAFSDLEIGDKVQIKHYHLYKYGYWQSPSFIDYKYIGVKNGEHHFQNVNYEHEHFRMKKDFEDNHVFIGKYKA